MWLQRSLFPFRGTVSGLRQSEGYSQREHKDIMGEEEREDFLQRPTKCGHHNCVNI